MSSNHHFGMIEKPQDVADSKNCENYGGDPQSSPL